MPCTITRLFLPAVLCGTQLFAQQQFDNARQLEQKLSSDILTSKSDERTVREDEQSIPPRIQNLLLSGILALLNSGATAADVQRKIESVLADSRPGDEPGTVGVLAFGGKKSSAIVVAFGIAYCIMCDRTWLGTYEKISGTYSNTHAISKVLENHTIYLHRLPANDGKQRFVLYGTRLGASDNLLTVKCYEFSPGSLHEVWKLDGLNNGTLEFHDDEIVVRYLLPGKTPLSPSKGRVDKYRVTPEGLSFESRSEHPE